MKEAIRLEVTLFIVLLLMLIITSVCYVVAGHTSILVKFIYAADIMLLIILTWLGFKIIRSATFDYQTLEPLLTKMPDTCYDLKIHIVDGIEGKLRDEMDMRFMMDDLYAKLYFAENLQEYQYVNDEYIRRFNAYYKKKERMLNGDH